VRLKENQQKSTLAFKGGVKLTKTINFGGKLSFILSFLIKCLYFADTTERGDRGVKGGPKTR
jgi:hypothetical protein